MTLRSWRSWRFNPLRLLPGIVLLLLGALPAFCDENPYLQRALEARVQQPDTAVLVVDVRTGASLAAIHPETLEREKYPPGSLIKIFTAVAFAAEHGGSFPAYFCPRTTPRNPDGCWDRSGHGDVELEKAIAFSCNVYFRKLAEQVSPAVFAGTLARFGVIRDPHEILAMPEGTVRKLMVGDTAAWAGLPVNLLRGYCALYNGGRLWKLNAEAPREVQLPAIELLGRIRAGMKRGGESGTSALASRICGQPVLGKTGTSMLLENGIASWSKTQGWWIGLYPADHPQIAVMTFVRIGRGAVDAAPLGGRVLAEYLKLSHARPAAGAGTGR